MLGLPPKPKHMREEKMSFQSEDVERLLPNSESSGIRVKLLISMMILGVALLVWSLCDKFDLSFGLW